MFSVHPGNLRCTQRTTESFKTELMFDQSMGLPGDSTLLQPCKDVLRPLLSMGGREGGERESEQETEAEEEREREELN